MDLIIGLLTFILVLTCIILTLLILIQLPKKEAGAGLAFGGAASDALFGAGSGNVLTKVTKYAAGVFLGLALFLAVLQNHRAKNSSRGIAREMERRAAAAAVTAPPSLTSSNAGPVLLPGALTSSNLGLPRLTTQLSNPPPVKPAIVAPLTNTSVVPAPKPPPTNAPAAAEAPGK